MLTPKKVAVIGFGEAGSVVAEGCVAGAKKLQTVMECHAWDIRMRDPAPKAALQKAANAIGVMLHDSPGEWLGEMDVVFSLDSVVAALGLLDSLVLMVAAVCAAMLITMLHTERLSAFILRHPSLRALCLNYLLLIGLTLGAASFGFHSFWF